jgi:hypothetical protein
MGACECQNPMEFGYEVNAEKDDDPQLNNNYNTNKINFEKNYINTQSNNSEKKIENNNFLNNNVNQSNNYYSMRSQNSNYIENIEEEKQPELLNSLNSRFESDQKQLSENFDLNFGNNDNGQQYLFNTTIEQPSDIFSKYIFDNLNKIRENPQSFIPKIENAKSNITHDKNGICIYKSSVKVALSRGLPAFNETIEYLQNLKPMKKLIFSSDLLIPPPDNEEQLTDKTYMNQLINEKVQNGIPIKSFWRDIIKDYETCLLLMIVDDTGSNSGKKRNDILDPNMQCIGITSKKIGKKFASYITLC